MPHRKNKIELLSPAGDLEKLKIAVNYGADAVYMGGKNLGLRAKAKNFDFAEMEEAVHYAHSHHVKVYVTANIFAHNQDFDGIESYFFTLGQMGVDALIISDPGIFQVARKTVPEMEIHISTQANNTNYQSALFWRELGAKRVVLARELSFGEIKEIHEKIHPLDEDFILEAFVHGAMCISYSGRCLLSNYMADRDSNKGECAHPCRWQYYLMEEKRPNEFMPVYEDERGTYIYNSKDLCMVQHLPDILSSGIQSLKIEGRMKTAYYVAAVTKIYREAIDDFYKDPENYQSKIPYYMAELKKSSHRDFTTGFYYGKPDGQEQIYTNNSYIRNYDFVAVVESYDEDSQMATVQQRNKFVKGDTIEVLRARGENTTEVIEHIYDDEGREVEQAPHPKEILKIKLSNSVEKLDMFRKSTQE